jgi:hypothetical protein
MQLVQLFEVVNQLGYLLHGWQTMSVSTILVKFSQLSLANSALDNASQKR